MAGEEVRFSDTSSGQPTSWQWNFPDGSGSTESDPVYVFAQPGSYQVTLTVANSLGSDSTTRTVTVAGGSGCPTATALCLNNSRFRVEVDWRDFQGHTGSGQVVPIESDDSGLFWFFDANNWEMLVKVLDGCGINDHFWIFAAATTNVEYTLRVTDTQTGAVVEYLNPLGNAAAAITDTGAFATCP